MWNWREVRVDTTALGDTVKSSIVARQDGEEDTDAWEEVKTAKQLARYIDDNNDGAIADAARDARDDIMVVFDMLEDDRNASYRFLNKLLKLYRLLDEERNGQPD